MDKLEISEKYRWIFLHKYRRDKNYIKLMEMLKNLKNDKISKNIHVKVIL